MGDAAAFPSYRAGVEILAVLAGMTPAEEMWRRESYEFVRDRPAIDLLTGGPEMRRVLDGDGDLHAWLASWRADEESFRREREPFLLYR